MDERPAALSYAEREPPLPPLLRWAGVAAVALAVLQVPWVCAGFAVMPSPSDVTHLDFVLLRARAVAPAIGSILLACVVRLDRRRGAHHTLATVALTLALVVLFLVDYASKWHAGD